MKLVSAVLMLVFLFGCTSGTYLVTGTKREPIDAAQVIIYNEAPEKYEIIGTVEASSEAGATDKRRRDSAVGKLKKLAARIGANGVIINSVEVKQYRVPIHDPDRRGGTNIKTVTEVSGEAIYVPNQVGYK